MTARARCSRGIRRVSLLAALLIAGVPGDAEVTSPDPQYVYDLYGDQILPPRAAAYVDGDWRESVDPNNPFFVQSNSALGIRIWRYDEDQPEGQRLRISFMDWDTWSDPSAYPSPILTLWTFGDGQEIWTTNTIPQTTHTYLCRGARELEWFCEDWPYVNRDDFPSRTDAPCARPWADVAGTLCLHVVADASDHIVYVKPDGSDALDGRTWANAKQSIQTAITAASLQPGDEVWVAAGQSFGPFTMAPGVSVLGGFQVGDTSRSDRQAGHASLTVVNGVGGLTPTVLVPGTVDRSCMIDGLTIRNGYYGVHCQAGAAPVIARNVITANSSSGIRCEGPSDPGPLVRDNVITDNHGTYGGGISCEGCSAEIVNNEVRVNGNPVDGNGGGIWCSGGASGLMPEIRANTIEQNSAPRGGMNYTFGFGGGIYATDGAGLLAVNNLISENSAAASGDGLYLAEVTMTQIKSNWVSDNQKHGVFCDTTCGSDVVISNNTITEHVVLSGGDAAGVFCLGGGRQLWSTTSLRSMTSGYTRTPQRPSWTVTA